MSETRAPVLTFADALATVELTPGEASTIFYTWASGFHDTSPDLAGKLRAAGDALAYAPPAEAASSSSSSTRRHE